MKFKTTLVDIINDSRLSGTEEDIERIDSIAATSSENIVDLEPFDWFLS